MLGRRDLMAMTAFSAAVIAAPGIAAKPAQPSPVRLWPQGAPEPVPSGLKETMVDRSTDPLRPDRSLKGVDAPWLEMFQPDKPSGAVIIAIPGGGYRHMAWDKEGLDIARWFAARGVTAFALSYRLPNDGWQGGPNTPLADAQRAVRLLRGNAGAWGIDPERIAVIGFSAGGHLAANLGAQFDLPVYVAQDEHDSLSARPNLVAPVYPAIMIDRLEQALPAGQMLFGQALSADGLQLHSPHLNVRENSPPHFLLHAEDDPLVSADHSLALRAALVAKNIPVETHLYAKGGHGFGIRNVQGLPLEGWPERLLAFGKATGWIKHG
jgi:acetyl esterase/lipase